MPRDSVMTVLRVYERIAAFCGLPNVLDDDTVAEEYVREGKVCPTAGSGCVQWREGKGTR